MGPFRIFVAFSKYTDKYEWIKSVVAVQYCKVLNPRITEATIVSDNFNKGSIEFIIHVKND